MYCRASYLIRTKSPTMSLKREHLLQSNGVPARQHKASIVSSYQKKDGQQLVYLPMLKH